MFIKALSDFGLKQALKDDGPFTIFPPIDEAFAKSTAGKLESLIKPESRNMPRLLAKVEGGIVAIVRSSDDRHKAPIGAIKILSEA